MGHYKRLMLCFKLLSTFAAGNVCENFGRRRKPSSAATAARAILDGKSGSPLKGFFLSQIIRFASSTFDSSERHLVTRNWNLSEALQKCSTGPKTTF